MSGFLKKFSDFLGLSDPDFMNKAPPLDGEIIYCKNNVCVHPPSNLSTNMEHYPGYLTIRAQGNGNVQSSLLLTWIPNTSLNKSPSRRRILSSSSESSPCFDRRRDGRVRDREDQSDDNISRDTAFSLDASTPAKPSKDSPVGSLQSFQDSGIGETDKTKSGEEVRLDGSERREDDVVVKEDDNCNENGTDLSTDNTQNAENSINPSAISTQQSDASKLTDTTPSDASKLTDTTPSDASKLTDSTPSDASKLTDTTPFDASKLTDTTPSDASKLIDSISSNSSSSPLRGLSSDNDSRRHSDLSKSSDSDGIPTEAQLAALLSNEQGEIDEETKKKTGSLERPSALGLSEKDKTESSIDTTEGVKSQKLPTDDVDKLPHSSSSTTTPTTSNPDLGSLPSSPSDASSFDPFLTLYNKNSPDSTVTSPEATYNLTFPENAVLYSSPGGRKSPRPSPKEQLCGVFSVDLSEMRSLRLFFSNAAYTSGQLVIASRESQYKILHFHHGGLDRLAEVFEEWRYCIKQSSKKTAGDEDAKQLYRKFNILQTSLKPAECHPEEGIYGELEEEMLWSHMNEKGQIEDDYQLRKAIFFGGIDEYMRAEVWPFVLHFYAYDSTTEERNALKGQKREEYNALNQNRLAMVQEEYEEFWRNVQSIVDKDVVRTDRSHPYFKGKDNPHIDNMRNILLNYAVYNPSMGYSQGMSDLLSPILAELQDEANAFWCFVGLMQSVLFVSSPKDEDMEKQLGYLRNLIKLMMPEFWAHLDCLGDAMDLLFCHRWILLCFKREFHEQEALRMWEACWAHYQTDYFHLFICLAILGIYGDDVVQQKLASDDMLLHFSNLSMQMDGPMVLKKARSLLHKFRTLPCIPCTLDKLCERCAPGQWDSGHTPEVECVGFHEEGYVCPHIR